MEGASGKFTKRGNLLIREFTIRGFAVCACVRMVSQLSMENDSSSDISSNNGVF